MYKETGWAGVKIEQYLYILEIADSGSFSQAARNLFVSQPNLSYIVKQMELKMGAPIFKRTSNGVVATEEGAELIERLRFLKQEHEMIEELLETRDRTLKLSFRLASQNMLTTSVAFQMLVDKYSGCAIDFSHNDFTSFSEISDQINEVDLAIIGTVTPYISTLKQRLHNKSIEYHPITDLPIFAIVGQKNPYYMDKESITMDELRKSNIVQLTDSAKHPRQSILHLLGLADRTAGSVKVNNTEEFYALIQKTTLVGVDAMSPERFLQVNDLHNMKIIQIEGCSLHWQLAWIKSRYLPLSDVAADYLDILQKMF